MKLLSIVAASIAAAAPLALPAMAFAQDAPKIVTVPLPDSTIVAKEPVPSTDPGTWVGSGDYPAWALRNEVEGRVKFQLTIDKEGKVQNCEVTETSGVEDLDITACAKIIERARFVPAKDKDGNPVVATWSSAVRWQIPDRQKMPDEGELQFSMTVEKDGKLSDCKIIKMAGAAKDPCLEVGEQRAAPIYDTSGQPQRTKILVTTKVTHEAISE